MLWPWLKMLMESGPVPLIAFRNTLENPLCRKVHVILNLNEAGPSTGGGETGRQMSPRAKRASVHFYELGSTALGKGGKGGKKMQTLRRCWLPDRLCNVLDAGWFRFWLDARQQMLARGTDESCLRPPEAAYFTWISDFRGFRNCRRPPWSLPLASDELSSGPDTRPLLSASDARAATSCLSRRRSEDASTTGWVLGYVQSMPFAGGTLSATLHACSALLTARQLRAALAKLQL